MDRLKQVAALPVRRDEAGNLQVLLVTSRETRRWVIPKGWPWPDVPDYQAAANEAREEAGIVGTTRPQSIGSYGYGKRRKGSVLDVEVAVFLLEVTFEEASWPEQGQRERAWFTPDAAARAVHEPELQALIRTIATRT